MYRVTLFLFAIFLIIKISGCGAYRDVPASDEQAVEYENKKIKVEASLFDARLYKDNKPTSFRLEVFQTDTLLGVAGRGYLGKGAFKGWMRQDSLMIYFPTTKEYLYEATSDLLRSDGCVSDIFGLDIMRCFQERPQNDGSGENFVIMPVEKEKNKSQYVIYQKDCPWQLEILYDLRKKGWRIKKFEFTNGDNFILKGQRREYKPNAGVKLKRFRLDIPPGAVRITL